MPVREIEPGQSLGLAREQTVLCIPVYGAKDFFSQCIASVLRTVPDEVPILIADDATPDPGLQEMVERLHRAGNVRHDIVWMRQPANVGFVGNVNTAFVAAAPADVIILNSDCVVPSGWFEELVAVGRSDPRIATVSVLTNHGTILSVPNRNQPGALPQDRTIEDAAEAVREGSLRLSPELPTGIGHCLLVKRSAIDLVGPFDNAFSPGYGEEVDFSQRCQLHGLSHVLADAVIVQHHGSASFNRAKRVDKRKKRNDEIVNSRYGYYEEWVDAVRSDPRSPLARSLSAASRSLRGLTVTVDGRCLTPVMTGTQLHVLELVIALEKTEGLSVRVVVPPDLGAYAQEAFSTVPELVVIEASDVEEGISKTDVVHRPFQVSSESDLEFLALLGERIVITHQDLIAYSNPGYFPDFESFAEYRELTHRALDVCDRVLFFSNHSAREAVGANLVETSRAQVVFLGTNHVLDGLEPDPEPPANAERLSARPFLLCLGTDFRHKNRAFAMRILHSLVQDYGWPGGLILAGPRVAHGSSAGEEAEVLMECPELSERVVTLPAVTEGEKRWLLENAAAVLYPTTYEGFGLGPYEAAEADVPCLFAAQTALGEFLPSRLASIVQWDPDASAQSILPLLEDTAARADHVAGLKAASARLTWERTGESLKEAYSLAADSSARRTLDIVLAEIRSRRERDEMESEVELLEAKVEEVSDDLKVYVAALGHDSMALVGPDGSLPNTLVRPLLAVTQRPLLRTALKLFVWSLYAPGYLVKNRRLPQRGGHELEAGQEDAVDDGSPERSGVIR